MSSSPLHQGALWLLLIFLNFASPISSYADRGDPLTELSTQVLHGGRSHELKEQKELFGAKWFTAGTNFSGIFIERKGPLKLLDWVGYVMPGFTPGQQAGERKTEYIKAERIFTDDEFNPIKVLILVPHPKYAPSVELGLIPAFYELQPPRLRASIETPVTVKGALGATLYQTDKGDYSLLIRLPRNAVLNISSTAAGTKKHILDLGNKLDVERLAQKLQS